LTPRLTGRKTRSNMRVRAVAAPSPESNAIGPLELACTAQGLFVTYLGVGAYREGYAPAAVTSGTSLLVPWPAVQEVRLSRDHLFVAVDPKVTPHNKLALVNFSTGEAFDTKENKRRAWLVQSSLVLGPLILGGGTIALLPRLVHGVGTSTAWLLGIAFALASALLGYGFTRVWLPSPRTSDDVLQEFVGLVRRFRPVPVGAPAAEVPTKDPGLDWNEVIARLPRSTLAVFITLTATGIAFVLTVARLTSHAQVPQTHATSQLPPRAAAATPAAGELPQSTPEPQLAPAANAPATVTSATATPQPPVTTSTGIGCECKRSDSVLWSNGFPKLTTLLIAQATSQHKDHTHLEIDLAAINNSAETIPEVNLMVQFYEDQGKTHKQERPLHYGSPLAPGQAIKWNVEARGTSFTVHHAKSELLTPPRAYAAANDFADLLNANHRPVRLHGAMMLAFLGDARAKGGATKLQEALRESEQPYLERVLQTQGDALSCDWRASTEGRTRSVSACVYNRSAQPLSSQLLRVRGIDRPFDHRSPVAPPPSVLVEKTWSIPGEIAPKTGVVTQFELDIDNPDGKVPAGFEFLVGGRDQLQ
jgi:hypothetical protein